MAHSQPDETCSGCGLTYDQFRTGLSFGDVSLMLWHPSENPANWRSRRRSGVLGFWRQLKKDLWAVHQRDCAKPADPFEDTEQADEIPW